MKSVMVLWLYSAEQYCTSTPINEIAEHASGHGFNDEDVDVLCLHGINFISAADIAKLRERRFYVQDVEPLFRSVAHRYPNLRRRYPNHFFECFLRWVVLKEFYCQDALLAWDADIFFNDKLSAVHAAFSGATCTSSSTCFLALSDPRWLDVYVEQLDRFEREGDAYLDAVFFDLRRRCETDPEQLDGCFFGGLVRKALASRQAWNALWTSTPEEMFVDYLVRTGCLPHVAPASGTSYLLCPQPLILPALAWSHPMGAGLLAQCPASESASAFEQRDGRYYFAGRPLAFLHFQGAVFRTCAGHQILNRFLNEPAPLYDEFYCPQHLRRGRAVSWFFNVGSGVRNRLAALPDITALQARWGDPFSERAVARNFLINGNLAEVMSTYCLPLPGGAPARDTILVVTHDPKHPLYTSWLTGSFRPVIFETNAGLDYAIPDHVGLVVASDCYREPRASLLCRAMEQGIPTLLLADGILEYRNTFDHPQIEPGVVFQPARGHKVACLGRSQARILESWGNAAQVEITGSARFDRYTSLSRRRRAEDDSFRILIATALTPYFTHEQHAQVHRSLAELKAFFAENSHVGSVAVEIVWRITKGLEQEIGVESRIDDLSGRELSAVLQHVDAVITTPSTTMIEAMLLGLPVALLDFTNSPHYVHSAWRITAPEHIAPTVEELIAPPAAKMLYQDTSLHDSLECTTPAAPRLLRLAEAMIVHGQKARALNQPLALSPRLLENAGEAPVPREQRHRLAELYPGHPQFKQMQIESLQVEVGQLRAHSAELEKRQALTEQALWERMAWRSRFEAASILAGHGRRPEAMRLMLESVKLAESTKDLGVVLSALLEIAPALGRLDVRHARGLLDAAAKLAERVRVADITQRVRQVREELERSVLVAVPTQHHPVGLS